MAPGGCQCVDSCSDGPRGACRIVQAVIACILLFVGIVMQLWSGTHVDDLPLATLCTAHSGQPDTMDVSDFQQFLRAYETAIGCKTPGKCIKVGESYQSMAGFFLSGNAFAVYQQRVDLMRYADESFYCKYVPHQVDSKNTSKTCRDIANECDGCSPFPCRLYPNQPSAPGKSNWHMATSYNSYGAIAHVNCDDKTRVFKNFLKAVFPEPEWRGRDIDNAAQQFSYTCLIDKSGAGYILNCGPVIALLGGIITTSTLFKCAHGPPWPEVGINLLILAIMVLLVGFWSISISTIGEISAYSICGNEQPPVTYLGKRYDGHPCIDRDTAGNMGSDKWNPFVYQLSVVYSTYVVGGVMTFLSVLMFLGLVTGFTETMMGDRFGKYLVSMQDSIPVKIHLPFPPSGSKRQPESGQ